MYPDKIILVRHGQSEGQVDSKKYATIPDHRIQLTDLGRQQAFDAGKKVLSELGKFPKLTTYCSPHDRCRQTFSEMDRGADGLFRKNFESEYCNFDCVNYVEKDKYERDVYEDPRLREQEWGNFRDPEETKLIQIERYKYGSFYYRFPNGESGADVYDRVSSFMDTMHRDFEEEDDCGYRLNPDRKNVLIVSHGMTIRIFLMRWFHVSVEEFETWDNPQNCGVYIMNLGKNGHYSMPAMQKWSETNGLQTSLRGSKASDQVR